VNKTTVTKEKDVCISQTSKTLRKFLLLFQGLLVQHPSLVSRHPLVPLPEYSQLQNTMLSQFSLTANEQLYDEQKLANKNNCTLT